MQTFNEFGQEQQPTYNYWTKTTMLMTQNNQVGDDNYQTTLVFLLFTEATKRGNRHFQFIIKQFLAMVISPIRCAFGD